jgi:ribulose-phosphate 3-epimerase
MIQIAPSIASADQSRLGWAVESADRGGADLIHLDIEDGVFIPNLTFGPKTIAQLRDRSGLPFDVHLQVQNPEGYLDPVVKAGANVVTVQVESTFFPYRVISILKKLDVRVGLAVAAGTSLEAIGPALDQIDVIHIMTAEPDGAADQFIESMLDKVQQARELVQSRPIEIEVDGGIDSVNAAKAVQAGASILVAGRAIWGDGDPAENIQNLRQAAQGT